MQHAHMSGFIPPGKKPPDKETAVDCKYGTADLSKKNMTQQWKKYLLANKKYGCKEITLNPVTVQVSL